MIWFKLYGTQTAPYSAALVKALFDLMQSHFVLRYPSGYVGSNKIRTRSNIQTWLDEALELQTRGDPAYPDLHMGIRLHGPTSEAIRTSWLIYSEFEDQTNTLATPEDQDDGAWITQIHGANAERATPYILVGLHTSLETSKDSASQFVDDLANLLLRNYEWWYGFIDVRPDHEIAIPPFYTNTLYNPNDWGLLVEQEWWKLFGLSRRTAVRNIYWGNFLGPQMRSALDTTGSIDFIREAARGNYEPWPEIKLGDHGMFIRLSKDPVWHEKNKHELTSGPDPTGQAAAILKEALSRASLL